MFHTIVYLGFSHLVYSFLLYILFSHWVVCLWCAFWSNFMLSSSFNTHIPYVDVDNVFRPLSSCCPFFSATLRCCCLLLIPFLSKFRSLIKYRNKIEWCVVHFHVRCHCDNGHYKLTTKIDFHSFFPHLSFHLRTRITLSFTH